MHLRAMVKAAVSEFKQKIEDFCKNREEKILTSEFASEVARGLQEATLSAAQAGYRTFLESYDTQEPVLQLGDTRYRRKMRSPKHILTVFGPITLHRGLYQADQGGKTYAPLDAMWGMADEYATSEVREACLFTLAHVTAQETASILKKCAGFHPSATAIQHMAEKVGTFVEANEEELSSAVRKEEAAPSETQALVVSMDGVNVLLNEPGPRQGRPKERPSSSMREEKTSYRNAMVGSLSFYGEVLPEEHTPKRLESRYIATMPEEKAPRFKQRLEEEVKHLESLVGSDITKMILCDGHKGIWRYVDSNPLFKEYVKGIDFYHTSEHLSRAAEALFGKSSPEATAWYESWYDNLLESDDAAYALIRSIDYYRKTRNLTKRRKKEIRKERTFFLRNKHRMKYAEFLRRGLPIGSGPVEAACKTIVKTRMGRSGMRWSRKGGQHILHLRAFVKSNRWDSFWNNHLQLRKSA
jgi:hypothetical protein